MLAIQIHVPENTSGLTIRDIPDISQQMKELIAKGVSEKDIGSVLIDAIGTGENFTKKALRILIGRSPLNKSSETGMNVKLQLETLLVSPKNDPELALVLQILNQKKFVGTEIQRVISSWSTEVLLSIHNFIYESLADGVDLLNQANKYTDLLRIVDSQLHHREVNIIQTENIPRKTFYGAGGLDISRKRVPSKHNIHHISTPSPVPRSPGVSSR